MSNTSIQRKVVMIMASTAISVLILASINNVTKYTNAFLVQPPKVTSIGSNDPLMQNCMDTGYSYDSCYNMLYSMNPGGYCTYLSYANVGCPQIQDPGHTYSDPQGAMQDSQNTINRLNSLIQQWDSLYPQGQGLN
jgi:hypothetical protein